MSVFTNNLISFFQKQNVSYRNEVFVHPDCVEEWKKVQTDTLKGTNSRPGVDSDKAGPSALRFLQSSYIHHHPNEWVKVQKSETLSKLLNMEQFGSFAAQKIRAGQVVIEYGGCLVHERIVKTWEKANSHNRYVFTLGGQSYLYGGGEWVIDGREYGNEARYINHSQKYANLRVVEIFPKQSKRCEKVAQTPHVLFITTRDIEKDEELFFDYQDTYWKVMGETPLEIPAPSTPVEPLPLAGPTSGIGGKLKSRAESEQESPAKRLKTISTSSLESDYQTGLQWLEKFRESRNSDIIDLIPLSMAEEYAAKIPPDHEYAQDMLDRIAYESLSFRIDNLEKGIEKENAHKRIRLMEGELRSSICNSTQLKDDTRQDLLQRLDDLITKTKQAFPRFLQDLLAEFLAKRFPIN